VAPKAERAPAGQPATSGPASGPLWFLADREALVQRFALRTLLRPPRFRRGETKSQ